MEKFIHQIAFDVFDFNCDKSEITRILGITPDTATISGEIKPNGSSYRRSMWILYSKAENIDSDFSEHTGYMIGALGGKEREIKEIKLMSFVKVTILGRFELNSRPSIHLDSKFINLLHINDIEVDFDFSVVSD